MSDELNCGQGGGADTHTGLRIASVFIILVSSGTGALFPVLAKRSSWLQVPSSVFKLVPLLPYLNPLLILTKALQNILVPASSCVIKCF